VAEKYFCSIGSVQNCVLKVNVSSPYFPFNPSLFEAEFLNTFKIFGLSHIKVVHVPVIKFILFVVGVVGGVRCVPNFSRKFKPPHYFPTFFLRISENLLRIELMPLPTQSLYFSLAIIER
jgi:hypothetical protein